MRERPCPAVDERVAIGLWLASASLLAFVAAWADKRAARAGKGRVPEATLLLLALVGGSPGLVLAMLAFRHKTRKTSFLARLAIVLALQGLSIYLLLRGRA